MLDCETIGNAFSEFERCVKTDLGWMVSTHCLYPSFEPVCVFIQKHGEGFIIHDGGGASRASWIHGREKRGITLSLSKSAKHFGCEVSSGVIRIKVPGEAWIWSGMASVANASADAARASVGKISASKEDTLISRTYDVLQRAPWKPEMRVAYPVKGMSGKIHKFGIAIWHDDKQALVDAVTPHHNSVASKYLAFSDTPSQSGLYKYALYDDDLDQEDKALLSNVADLVAFKAISGTNGRFLLN